MLYCKAAYYLEKMTGDLPNFAYMYGITKSSETLQKRFEDFVIFLFLESFYLEKCKLFFAEVKQGEN